MSDDTSAITHAYVGYRAGVATLVIIDDGSREMHRKLAAHLKGASTVATRMPIGEARLEIIRALADRKAAR